MFDGVDFFFKRFHLVLNFRKSLVQLLRAHDVGRDVVDEVNWQDNRSCVADMAGQLVVIESGESLFNTLSAFFNVRNRLPSHCVMFLLAIWQTRPIRIEVVLFDLFRHLNVRQGDAHLYQTVIHVSKDRCLRNLARLPRVAVVLETMHGLSYGGGDAVSQPSQH